MPVSHDIIAISLDMLHVVDATPKTFLGLLYEPGFITAVIVGIFSFIGILYSNKVQTINLEYTIKAERKRIERQKEIDMESQCLKIREELAYALSKFQSAILPLEDALSLMRLDVAAEDRSGAKAAGRLGYEYHRQSCDTYEAFNEVTDRYKLFISDIRFVNHIVKRWHALQRNYHPSTMEGLVNYITVGDKKIVNHFITLVEEKNENETPFGVFLENQIAILRIDKNIIVTPDYLKEK